MRISDWSSDVCSSDLQRHPQKLVRRQPALPVRHRPSSKARALRQRQDADPFAAAALDDGQPDRLVGGAVAQRRIHEPVLGKDIRRSEESRVGKEWLSTGSFRWSPANSTKTTK